MHGDLSKYPSEIRNVRELDEVLTRPSALLVDFIRTLPSPLLVLGAAGKMGPSLCLLAKRASELAGSALEVIAVSRFRDRAIGDWFEIKEIVSDKAGVPLEVTVERGDELVTVIVVPELSKQKMLGQEIDVALIGVVSSGKYTKIDFGLLGALKEAALETWKWIVRLCKFIVKLFTGDLSLKMLGGPITIGQMTGQAAQVGLLAVIQLMAIISINLGLINLFPVPILDGGHLLFLGIEAVLGRPLSEPAVAVAQRVGLALLIMLMAFAFYNDILRIITGGGTP